MWSRALRYHFAMSTPLQEPQIKVLLLENIHPSAAETLRQDGFEIKQVSGAMSEADLLEAIRDVQIVGIRSKTQITEKVLEAGKHLLCVGCFCIGTNQVDLVAANRLGVPVFNAPFSNTRSVAELVMAEVVVLARRLGDCIRQLHQNQWQKSATGRHEVRGKTLGVVGYGHIGSQVGVLAESFGMRVVFYDVANRLPMGNNQALKSLEQLLGVSDFVTLHVPETPDTKGMFEAKQLQAMRAGSYLLNASRGTVVNLEDLADALRSGHIAGAAVDVYPQEPRQNGGGFESPLIGLDNVVLTPHIGGSTEEAQESIGNEVATACSAFVTRGTTSTAVNFPQIDLRMRPGSHRVLNVHRNVPNVMGDLLEVLSELNANIHAQHLATDEKIGYLITDLDQDVSEAVKNSMRALKASIRTRVLS